jgi:hypothetical protein
MGGEENALLTYAKSQQVHNAVLNIATSYLIAKSAPPIGVHSPAQIVAPAPNVPANAGDVIAYPTLESLFRRDGLLRLRTLPLHPEPGGLLSEPCCSSLT